MSAPNLRTSSVVMGRTARAPVTTALSSVLSNGAGSGKVLKINSIICANVDGVSAADVSISIFNGVTDSYIARTVSVAPDNNYIASNKLSYFYLEEGNSLRAVASSDGDLDIIIGYEEIGPEIVQDTGNLFNNVSLLLHMDGSNGSTTFTDGSVNNFTVTANGNAQISTAQRKFGGASAYFDGNGDYLTVSHSDRWDLPGDFTIEAWVYFSGYSASYSGAYGSCIVANYSGTSGDCGWQLRINGTASSYDTVNLYTGLSDLYFTASFGLSSWTHLAATRRESQIKVFVNGSQVGPTVTNTDAFTENGTRNLWIGGLNDPTFRFWHNGFIDDLRITKGFARYTSNFIPPTAPFPDS